MNTLRSRQNSCYFAHNTLKCIILNENVWIKIKISLKFVPKGPIYNIPAIMAWCWPCNKPLSEPMMVSLLMHICVSWPQWFKTNLSEIYIEIQQFSFKIMKMSTSWSQVRTMAVILSIVRRSVAPRWGSVRRTRTACDASSPPAAAGLSPTTPWLITLQQRNEMLSLKAIYTKNG